MSAERVYSINYSKPGLVVVFNVKSFINSENFREGSEKDVEKLTQVFHKFKFEIKTHLDKNSNEIRRLINEYATRDFTNDSCFICFIMSHGYKGTIMAADENEIYLTEFIDPFKKVASLKNKPKIFFIGSGK